METLIIIFGGLFIIDRISDGLLSTLFLVGIHNFLVRLFFH
jgi:hypothetical protein